MTEANQFLVQAEQAAKSHPVTPPQMEQWIREANALLETLPDVLLEINERRYQAERAWSAKRNQRIADHAASGDPVTVARAKAEVDAQAELEAWHRTKAEYHYAEDTERALRTQIMSMLNINKSVASQYGSFR